ncbi:hypothetical protein RHECIAT_CH0003313 [Rhizobium etli CIAT 652]|uniref:Uncharacterized protein n=1 Tax=Rhizobium etli (strain CIAT 652) TaxID=491916 RepID=B3PVP1_RHIE6|nr:hypothetical protein RHECIAT_CH0003313 [Rhizobium etli CIAT 652]
MNVQWMNFRGFSERRRSAREDAVQAIPLDEPVSLAICQCPHQIVDDDALRTGRLTQALLAPKSVACGVLKYPCIFR